MHSLRVSSSRRLSEACTAGDLSCSDCLRSSPTSFIEFFCSIISAVSISRCSLSVSICILSIASAADCSSAAVSSLFFLAAASILTSLALFSFLLRYILSKSDSPCANSSMACICMSYSSIMACFLESSTSLSFMSRSVLAMRSSSLPLPVMLWKDFWIISSISRSSTTLRLVL